MSSGKITVAIFILVLISAGVLFAVYGSSPEKLTSDENTTEEQRVDGPPNADLVVAGEETEGVSGIPATTMWEKEDVFGMDVAIRFTDELIAPVYSPSGEFMQNKERRTYLATAPGVCEITFDVDFVGPLTTPPPVTVLAGDIARCYEELRVNGYFENRDDEFAFYNEYTRRYMDACGKRAGTFGWFGKDGKSCTEAPHPADVLNTL